MSEPHTDTPPLTISQRFKLPRRHRAGLGPLALPSKDAQLSPMLRPATSGASILSSISMDKAGFMEPRWLLRATRSHASLTTVFRFDQRLSKPSLGTLVAWLYRHSASWPMGHKFLGCVPGISARPGYREGKRPVSNTTPRTNQSMRSIGHQQGAGERQRERKKWKQ
jgi:hypothetical protein